MRFAPSKGFQADATYSIRFPRSFPARRNSEASEQLESIEHHAVAQESGVRRAVRQSQLMKLPGGCVAAIARMEGDEVEDLWEIAGRDIQLQPFEDDQRHEALQGIHPVYI